MTQPPPGPGPSSHGHNPQQGWQSQRNRRTPGTPPGRPPFPAHPVGTSRPTPRPPRKSTRPLVLAYSCGALLLSLVLVLVYVFATGTGPSSADNELLEPAAPTPTLSPPAASSTTEQSPSSSESPSSSPSDTATPTEGDPPPQKIFKLADHPILQDPDAGLANRACHLPGWRSTPEGAEAFFTAARECLDAAWEPFLRAYNLPFTPPRLHFPASASFQTQCGTINVGIATAAYYCEGDLYLPFDGLQTEQYGNAPGVYLALFAHEYGHHVQELAGIMDAAWERIYAEGQDSPAGQEMSRRKELQAQCFSGMFLGAHVDQGGSITREMYNAAWYDQETRGDDTSGTRDHGSNANYAKWWRAGAYDNRIVDCNTFAAPASEVS
ncbi:neutral zinc metallopeptidase [Saccharomonospora viridis]|uniref:neutral zinc metallopeptidase n=1 Tax=Saccharomonospora viridis TaxID=1852 RepID=UPI003C6E78E1